MAAPRMLQHYRLLEKLGSGGMGEVYSAVDTRLDRRVAIKLLPPELAEDPVYRRRFARESKALAALDHRNVVTVHAVESDDDGQPFLVMELVEGVTLREVVPVEGLPPRRCLELFLPVVDAMAAAHRAGIVHRDLKPDNVMVRNDGLVKVVDFGLSKREPVTVAGGRFGQGSEALTQEGFVVGTVHYLPPEHLEGRPVGPAADVFSLGVVLYEMVTGERPFLGRTPLSVVSAILRDEPRLLKPPANDRIPAPLAAVLARCLAKDPAERYADAGELLAALQAIDPAALEVPVSPAPASSSAAAAAAPGGLGRLGRLGAALGALPRRRMAPAATAVGGLAVALGAWVALRGGPEPPAFLSPAATAGAPAPSTAPPATARDRPTVAVLPVRELSGDPDRQHFAQGATEALTASLARLGGLRVISQASASSVAREGLEPDAIAEALGADYLVRGSVAREDDGTTVLIVQVVDPATGETLWGDTRQGSLADVLGAQAEVAAGVARAVRAPVSAADAARLHPPAVLDEETWDLFLRGRWELARRTPESLQKALALFQQVASVEPRFAPAHVAIAEATHALGTFGYAVESTGETITRGERAARRAIELDPEAPEAWAVLALNRLLAWQWEEAEGAFLQALTLNPSDALARHYFSVLLSSRGRHREALAQIARARELDPLSRPVAQAEGAALYFAGDYRGAIESARRSLEAHPDHWFFLLLHGAALSLLREHDDAAAALEKALASGQRNSVVLGAAAVNLARAGERARAQALREELERRRRVGYVSSVLLAKLAFALDDPAAAHHWLDRALEERDFSLIFLEVDPDFAPYADDPQVRRVAQRVASGG